MDSNQIRCMLSCDKKTRQKFIGVLALDEFKSFVQKNTLLEGLYVINSDNSDSPGRHWFMIFYDKDYLAFFDSFARSSNFYNITKELNSVNRKIDEVPFQLQHFFSDVCGEYVILFSYNLCRNRKLIEILKRFSVNHKDNDNKVIHFVNKHFPGHAR